MAPNVRILKNKNSDFQTERARRQARVDAGELPGFPAKTAPLGDGDWRVERPAGAPADLCLTGVESRREARVWGERFRAGEPAVEHGLILRVDSLWAAFELDEIVHELRGCLTALHASHDGFLAGFVGVFHRFPEYVLPDRADMTGDTHFLRSFSRHVAETARRHGVAVAGDAGGTDPEPAGRIEAADLLLVPRGRITERGMRENIGVALRYLGRDDEPTAEETDAAELARALLWQWVRHETGVLDIGRIVTPEMFRALLDDEAAALGASRAASGRLAGFVLGESYTMHAFGESPA